MTVIHWIPLLGVLAVVVLGVDRANDPVVALWPQQTDAKLSLSVDADGLAIVKASNGGALGTFNMKIDIESEILFDPLLDAIEIVWVPACDARSSTFDRFWANSQRFDGINAEGIHLQAKLRDASWDFVNETVHERIEENIRNILHIVLPSIDILPQLSKGFLAKSLCGFRSWTARNPLQESLHEPVDKSSSLCYSSSFPLSPKNESTTFFNRIIREANGDAVDSLKSVVERTVLENKQSFYTVQREHCLAAVKFGRSLVSSAAIEAEVLEVWVSQSDTVQVQTPWVAALPVPVAKSNILVVTSIARELGLDKLAYAWVQRGGKPGAPRVASSVLEIQIPKTAVAASVQAAIVGEGFHRRYVMDVELLENEVKTACDKTVLMLVPVSRTVYLDLDELRRMERIGDLKLLSFTKHIEIERPSLVSSQHVVGLAFIMFVQIALLIAQTNEEPSVVLTNPCIVDVFNRPTSNQAHMEFPLHFRYQAPSETDLYRLASVIAPDLFLVCPNGDRSVKRKLKSSNDGAVQNYFQTWGLTRLLDPASGDHHWLRLKSISPIPVIDVPVPVGYLPSAWLVSSVTLLFASMGAALLLWVSIGVAKRAQDPSTSNHASWKGKAH